MAILTTKFSVGDTVWFSNTTTEKRRHDCPDCLGEKLWKCTSPAGGEFTVACPRCSAQYQSDRDLSLDYAIYVPAVRALTVGLVRASSQEGEGYGEGNEYMCNETGIGSGSLYRENKLFATKEEATAAAQVQADEANADPQHWVAQQYSKSLKFSDYELKDAVMEAAKSRASRVSYDVGYLVEALEEAETISEVRERIQEWKDDADKRAEMLA